MQTSLALRGLGLLAPLLLGGPAGADPVGPDEEAAEVRALFEEYVERSAAFDPGVASLYAPDARIVSLRDGAETIEIRGAEYREMIGRVMPLARKRGDVSRYADVEVARHGDGYRVTATRTSAVKCVDDPDYHLDVAKVDGSWRIVEEYTETVSLSRCDPSPELAARLAGLVEGIEPHLPLDLDEDTRLESVEIAGSALVYHQRLHTVVAAETDLERLSPVLKQAAVREICGTPTMKAIVDAGGSVRYAYVDRDGAAVVNADVPAGLCP